MRSRTIRACGEGRHRPTGPGLSGQKTPAAASPHQAPPSDGQHIRRRGKTAARCDRSFRRSDACHQGIGAAHEQPGGHASLRRRVQAGQRYPRPRHGPTPRTAVWSKPEAPGFGDDGVLHEGVLQACFVLLALQEIGVLPMSMSDPKDPSMPRHVRMLSCITTPPAGNGDCRPVRPCPPGTCRRHKNGCGGSRRATDARLSG